MKTFNFLSTVKSISIVLFLSLIINTSLSAQSNYLDLPFDEAELVVEDWMSDLNSYNTDEKELQVEDWMADLDSYGNNDELLLTVESWMTDLASFNIDEEETMDVELWMTSLDEFYNGFDNYLIAEHDEEPIMIEDWMTDLNNFNRMSASEIEGIKDIDLDDQTPILIALKH